MILGMIAITILTPLAAYAWYLTQKVKQAETEQQAEQDKEAAAAAHNLRQKQLSLLQDIRFIARSILAEQCEITEGVLRLHYLITTLDADVWHMPDIPTLREHYQATQDMPILDAYQQLPRKEQFKLDKQRWDLEDKNKKKIEQELNWLVTYSFPGVTLLQ